MGLLAHLSALGIRFGVQFYLSGRYEIILELVISLLEPSFPIQWDQSTRGRLMAISCE